MIDSSLPIKEQIKQLLECKNMGLVLIEPDVNIYDSPANAYESGYEYGVYMTIKIFHTYLKCILNSEEI